jgi:hypothetical protein
MFRYLNRTTFGSSVFIIVALLLLNACSGVGQNSSAKVSTTSAAPLNGPSPATTQPRTAAAAPGNQNQNTAQQKSERPITAEPAVTMAEAQATVNRIYRTALTLNTNRPERSILVGDFNRDGSQDLAVIVKPVKDKLQTLNSPYAPWTVEDLSKINAPVERNGVRVLPAKSGPTRVEENDELLVIVHGYQESGWRNPQAQQTYLLRHAVGDVFETQPSTSMLNNAAQQASLNRTGGDVIKEEIANQPGFIYWTGAKYAWYRKQP